MMNNINQDIKVGISRFGKGLFSKRIFRKGEIIFKFTGKMMNFSDTILLGDLECYTIQIDKDIYINPDEPYCYINHSCDPNCGINQNMGLIAIRDIKTGAELFFDYSTTMFERHWQMDCLCDSSNCRKVIKDFDLLPEEISKKYLDMDIVLPFIKELLVENPSSKDVLS